MGCRTPLAPGAQAPAARFWFRRRAASLLAAAILGACLAAPTPAVAAFGFTATWGQNVVLGGSTGFEVCAVESMCRIGDASSALGGEMYWPEGVAVGPNGDLYVADRRRHRIQQFTSTGNFMRAWGQDVATGGGTGFEVCTEALQCKSGVAGGALGGELDVPMAVSADPAGNVYVADAGNLRIQVFTATGSFVRAWGKDVVSGGGTGFEVCTDAATCKTGEVGELGGDLGSLTGVAADTSGNVYVTEDFNRYRLQKFSSTGTFLRAWGSDVVAGGGTGFEVCTAPETCKRGRSDLFGGALPLPLGVAVGASGNVYVADGQRVQQFASSGGFMRAWGKDVVVGGATGFEVCTDASQCSDGEGGGLGGEMDLAQGVTTDASGNVYVADSNRIQQFDPSGGFIRAWGKDVVVGGTSGFEVCADAALCQQLFPGGSGGTGGAMNRVEGVSVDSAGNVYAADRDNNRVQKFGDVSSPGGGDSGNGGSGSGADPASGRTEGTSAPPSNAFSFRVKPVRGGKAFLKVAVPGPGRVVAEDATRARSGHKRSKNRPTLIKRAEKTATGAGQLTLKLEPTSAAKKALRRRLVATVKITFTPRNGLPASRTAKVTLKR
jgi:NHL repeat